MGFLNNLFNRISVEEPKEAVVLPRRPFVNSEALEAQSLRVGMWVVCESGEVGILTGCDISGVPEVTVVKEDGSTKMVLNESDYVVPLVIRGAARQAYIDEIPAARRPSEDVLVSMGYKGAK